MIIQPDKEIFWRELEGNILPADERVRQWLDPDYDSSLHSEQVRQAPSPTDEKQAVFVRRADLKIQTSRIAMHLHSSLRNILFDEIDRLYDEDHYKEREDAPILSASYKSFLRFLVHNRSCRPPKLGVSLEGHLLTAWKNDDQKLFLEFLPGDRVRLSVVKEEDNEEPDVTSCSCNSVTASKILDTIGALDLIRT